MANKEDEKTKEVKKSAPATAESNGSGKTVAVAVLATELGLITS